MTLIADVPKFIVKVKSVTADPSYFLILPLVPPIKKYAPDQAIAFMVSDPKAKSSVKSLTVQSYFFTFPPAPATSQYNRLHARVFAADVPNSKVAVKSVTLEPSYFFILPESPTTSQYEP